jgi:hypothetical protein
MTRRPWPVCAVAMALISPAGGCMYTADVRNTTDGPVLVRMVQKQALKREWSMDSTRVPPGERVRLGPARSGWGKVLIEAGERTRTEEPVTHRIGAGQTDLEITLAEDGRTLVLRTKPGDHEAPPAEEPEQAAASTEDEEKEKGGR